MPLVPVVEALPDVIEPVRPERDRIAPRRPCDRVVDMVVPLVERIRWPVVLPGVVMPVEPLSIEPIVPVVPIVPLVEPLIVPVFDCPLMVPLMVPVVEWPEPDPPVVLVCAMASAGTASAPKASVVRIRMVLSCFVSGINHLELRLFLVLT